MVTLILGGARSGKSDLGERLARGSRRPVLVVATMQPADGEMRARIAAHRAARPVEWRTVEEPLRLVDALAEQAREGDFVLIDCVTLWVTNLLLAALPAPDDATPDEIAAVLQRVTGCARDLLSWAEGFNGDVAIVSNEVGLGLVPPYPLGRIFRDALGAANRLLAAEAGRVYYMVAGLVLDVTALGARPLELLGDGPPS